jgi:hypothetical protein
MGRRRIMMRFRFVPIFAGLATAAAMTTVGGLGTSVAAASNSPGQLSASAVGAYKASHDTQAAYNRAVAASYAHQSALKMAMYREGLLSRPTSRAKTPRASVTTPLSVVSGSGYAYLSPLNQQGQQRSYWCGPATVSEIAWTVPGPSNVNQSTAASWMGTNTSGTSTGQETSGLNHFVGVPDYGWNFYAFVSMDGNPTSSQRSAFYSDLQTDVSLNSPVGGDAWEVPGGPHLVGHPSNLQIFHWFEIGGWSNNSGKVYYADSATTIWSSVPPYSWYNTYNLETILGGRGYAW